MEATASEDPGLRVFYAVVACMLAWVIVVHSDDATKVMYRYLAIIALVFVKIATIRFVAIIAMDTVVEFLLGLVCPDLRDITLFQNTLIPRVCASPRAPEFERTAVFIPLVASVICKSCMFERQPTLTPVLQF